MTASGEALEKMGSKVVKSRTQYGRLVGMRYHIAKVANPLDSVSKVCDKGNEVVFNASGGYVRNVQSGANIQFNRREGVHVLSTCTENAEEISTVFDRRGAGRVEAHLSIHQST